MGAVVQREHRRPHVQEGAGTHRQRRRQAGSQPQPQDAHVQGPVLIQRGHVLIFPFCQYLQELLSSISETPNVLLTGFIFIHQVLLNFSVFFHK